MRFKFIGDPQCDPPEMVVDTGFMGISFPAGEAVDVKDEALIEKLKNHSHFKAVPGRAKAEPEEVTEDGDQG